MAMRILLFLACICSVTLSMGQRASLVDHLDEAASLYGYSLVYTPAAIPDTSFYFQVVDSASAKTIFERLTNPFGLTYNLLANQVIITAIRREFVTFSGFVEDAVSGERLVGAAVYLESSTRGTYTNGYGYFSLPKLNESDVVTIKYLGYPARRIRVGSIKGGRTTVKLRASYQLALVEIFPVDEQLSKLPKFGRSIPLSLIQMSEFIRGRPDLNAWLGMQPGINSAPFGYGGVSIRGADPEHNLVLLDDATLYLPSHLAGYMSIVPGEAIKSLQLYKNAGKARYGDRVGGVVDVRLRDGSTEKRRTNINFGISDVSINTEGPIGKGSYFLSGRRGLTDFWFNVLRPEIQPQESRIPDIDFEFYDLAGKVNYPLGPRQRIYASVFLGTDQYEGNARDNSTVNGAVNDFRSRSLRTWSNLVSSLRYNLTIGSRWFANTTLTFSELDYESSDFFALTEGINQNDPFFAASQVFYGTRLRDIGFRQDAEFAWKEGLSLKIGADVVQHRFNVGTANNLGASGINEFEEIDYTRVSLPRTVTYDASTYGYVDFQINPKLDVNLGVRVSGQLGGEETYLAVLPRFSFEYQASKELSFHGDAGMSRQYIHQVSTLNPGLKRDLWVPSVNGLTPQENRYVSLGLEVETKNNHAFGLDVFANQLDGLSRFGSDVAGANLEDWAQTISQGRGNAYGAELKYTGKLSAFQYDISYSYMVATRQFRGVSGTFRPQERFSLDRRHFSTFSGRYPLTDNWGVGVTWRIGSGLPARVPTANPLGSNPPPSSQPLTPTWTYGDDIEILDVYHSLDLGFRFTKSVKSSIYNVSFGVQNAYLRDNSFFLNLQINQEAQGGESTSQFTSVFIPILPFLRYGVTF